MISEIAEKCGELLVFQRTPSYVIPLQNHKLENGQADKIKSKYDELRALEKESLVGSPCFILTCRRCLPSQLWN